MYVLLGRFYHRQSEIQINHPLALIPIPIASLEGAGLE